MPKIKKRLSLDCNDTELSFSNVRKVHPALRGHVGYCLHKVAAIWKSDVRSTFEKEDLQGPHIAILSVISSSREEINQMKLCEETGIDKASMVKIIDHLEKSHFIERVGSKEDRRIKNLTITKKGTQFLHKGRESIAALEGKFLSALSQSEAEAFRKFLLRILDHHKTE